MAVHMYRGQRGYVWVWSVMSSESRRLGLATRRYGHLWMIGLIAAGVAALDAPAARADVDCCDFMDEGGAPWAHDQVIFYTS